MVLHSAQSNAASNRGHQVATVKHSGPPQRNRTRRPSCCAYETRTSGELLPVWQIGLSGSCTRMRAKAGLGLALKLFRPETRNIAMPERLRIVCCNLWHHSDLHFLQLASAPLTRHNQNLGRLLLDQFSPSSRSLPAVHPSLPVLKASPHIQDMSEIGTSVLNH